MENEIEVVIPYEGQSFSYEKYTDPDHCYLADALEKLGYDDISIGGWGAVSIGKDFYNPKEPFDMNVVINAFRKGESIHVTLIKDNY